MSSPTSDSELSPPFKTVDKFKDYISNVGFNCEMGKESIAYIEIYETIALNCVYDLTNVEVRKMSYFPEKVIE